MSATAVESTRSGVQPSGSDLSVAAAPAIEAEAEDILDDMTEDVALPPELMRFMELITNVSLKLYGGQLAAVYTDSLQPLTG